jgi:hypothetical protein
MAEENFQDFIRRERERLHAQAPGDFQQQRELDNKLADIERTLGNRGLRRGKDRQNGCAA